MRKERTVEVMPGGVGEVRALSTVDGGTALSTTKVRVLIPEGVEYITAVATGITSKVAQMALVPYLNVKKTADDSATFTDYSSEAQDNSASTDVDLSSLGVAADGDYLYVGCSRKFGGIDVDVDTTNSNASVMTATHSTNAGWSALSITDNTANAGASMGQDGTVTWTVPASWIKTRVGGVSAYWVRLQFSGALDATTKQNSIWAMPRYDPGEFLDGQAFESAVTPGNQGIVALQAEVDAGAANLVVNGYCGESEEL